MSIASGPSELGSQTPSGAPERPFTLRDLYVRASISGNSLAAELNRYLNFDGNTLVQSSRARLPANIPDEEISVHEKALAAILEVVTTNSKASFEYVGVPEPPGGVREWWARMLSGSLDNGSSQDAVQ